MNARFTRGISWFVCNVCGHRIRESETGDGAWWGCCELCYKIGECKNTMAINYEGSAEYQEAAQAHADFTAQLQNRTRRCLLVTE